MRDFCNRDRFTADVVAPDAAAHLRRPNATPPPATVATRPERPSLEDTP
jgi:hypothetical protein